MTRFKDRKLKTKKKDSFANIGAKRIFQFSDFSDYNISILNNL